MASGRKKMLVVCPFPQGVAAGQRLKYEQYFDDWRALGFDIDVSSFMDDAMWRVVSQSGHVPQKVRGVLGGHLRRVADLGRIAKYDLVYVFMYATPFGTTFFERAVRRLAKRVVFDVEDNILVGQKLPSRLAPNPVTRVLKNPSKAKHLIETADHVITSSPFLNDYCLTINESRQCTYISSSVDTDRFLPATTYTNDRPVVVGWTGTFSSRVYLDQLRSVFQRLAKRVPYKLRVIGNFAYELEGVDLDVVQWTKEHEVRDLQTFDIGVYPLPDNEWVLGKSGLKAIQYMAYGVPTVATNVGTAPMVLDDGKAGLLVKTDDEWVDALERLIREPELRRQLGTAARERAVRLYSTRAVAQQYRDVISKVMER